MNFERAEAFLYDRLNFERSPAIPYGEAEFKLDRMRLLLERLGDPHLGPLTVHVAGTKGKGSTCHFLSGMLSAAGYRAGCYTSPHLHRVEERFAINQVPCTESEFVSLVDQLRPVVESIDKECRGTNRTGPTFFEITTAMAMLHFKQQEVDVSILEVGLGGRLDSTNVCEPNVCVITSISFDHMRQLGDTLALIAGEKAGIIKPNVPVITGVTDREPLDVIRGIADEQKAPLRQLGVDFGFDYRPADSSNQIAAVDFFQLVNQERRAVADDVEIGTLGLHQAQNAALAWQACDLLEEDGLVIPISARRKGLKQTQCPGRIEVVSSNPTVIVDTAHNSASIDALVAVIEESFPKRPRILILAATQGKQVDSMVTSLLPVFETVVCTEYQHNPRAMSVDDLLAAAEEIKTLTGAKTRLLRASTPNDAWQLVRSQTVQPELVVATGSFFLAAEVSAALLGAN